MRVAIQGPLGSYSECAARTLVEAPSIVPCKDYPELFERIAAAYEQMEKACVVVDAGTAITIDCCNDAGDFLGGAIVPGAKLMLDSLHQQFKEGDYTIELKIGWNRLEVTDPRAILPFEIVNHRRDLMHKSYRADRMGYLAMDLEWTTERG